MYTLEGAASLPSWPGRRIACPAPWRRPPHRSGALSRALPRAVVDGGFPTVEAMEQAFAGTGMGLQPHSLRSWPVGGWRRSQPCGPVVVVDRTNADYLLASGSCQEGTTCRLSRDLTLPRDARLAQLRPRPKPSAPHRHGFTAVAHVIGPICYPSPRIEPSGALSYVRETGS